MKLKLDENLPESLLPTLASLGHDVDNVRVEDWQGGLILMSGRRHKSRSGFSSRRTWISRISASFLPERIVA